MILGLWSLVVATVAAGQPPLRTFPAATRIEGLPDTAAGPHEDSSTQHYDRLNAYPPKWFLDTSDCDAKILSHTHDPTGGIDGRSCEVVQMAAGYGSEAVLVYPIEPVLPIDALSATVAVMSAKPGARVGFRVRFPYVQDTANRRSESLIVYGAALQRPGEYATIGVGAIERAMRLQSAAIRQRHGVTADLEDPHVDAVVINAYTGPGQSALRIDELRINGMLSVSLREPKRIAGRLPRGGSSLTTADVRRIDPNGRSDVSGATVGEPSLPTGDRRAFAAGHITKILQHNGEPLQYLRTLGFDGVLLSSPPTIDILREAMLQRMLVYAPPPSAPDPALEPHLEPVAAWVIGSGEAVDDSVADKIDQTSRRLRSWPTFWQRPLMASPLDSLHRFGSMLDVVVRDLPPPSRGIPGGDEVAELVQAKAELSERIEWVVGVGSLPPEPLLLQTEAIAAGIGAPSPNRFRWHAMLRQAIQSLESSPHGIVYRSSRSLTSGTELSSQRTSALSYTNRLITAITPWIADAAIVPPPQISGGAYRCGRLQRDDTDVLLLTSTATRGGETLSGDGAALTLSLTPEDAGKVFWRLTQFSAERITPTVQSSGVSLQILSPDVAEILVISSDPRVGGRLSTSVSRFANQAGTDRWQLASEAVNSLRQDYNLAASSGLLAGSRPTQFIDVAEQTIREAEPMMRSGDVGGWFRQARRAEGWLLRAEWQLTQRLMPDWPSPTSSPPADLGALTVQTLWRPLMNDAGWGVNRLNSGGLDTPEMIGEGRWTFGRRLAGSATAEVTINRRGALSGTGALRATVHPRTAAGLPGGYAGTVIQIKSPAVGVRAGQAVRIDAMVRTVGFGKPHQGLLVYDTLGGQVMGVLVTGATQWTPVRLYRHAVVDGDVSVMFEVLGGGEVMIDAVQLCLWEPDR